MKKPRIGFIGQGYVGKNYADNFEARGYTVVRYAKEKPYNKNKDAIKDCEVVFIAVPTPTTPKGYDASIIRRVLPLTGIGKTVVLKSTIFPGLTEKIQEEFPDRIVINSPEFLSEATANYDASHPFVNIVGIAKETSEHKKAAALVHSILPKAPANFTMKSIEAEIIKYSHNCSGYTQIIFFNIMYDLSQKMGANWETIEEAIKVDPFIPTRYATPLHKSGRGAGGHCFIKDFAALREVYEKMVADQSGVSILQSMEKKNIELLYSSGKDVKILEGVYNISKDK
ncbi:MAG: UDP-glucose/GDP-mannose dehydrogenase dimerization [Parcubacteria group bacterium GW2011_GWA2_45_15]|nr:MAG: UDP-glucose/GDP-mannose dehydrogenase dimerization [Parcubacteria group bacterium GW2011_GWA2_45_15]